MENEPPECHYCGGECPNEPNDSEYLCDGFAGDIEDLYFDLDRDELKKKTKDSA